MNEFDEEKEETKKSFKKLKNYRLDPEVQKNAEIENLSVNEYVKSLIEKEKNFKFNVEKQRAERLLKLNEIIEDLKHQKVLDRKDQLQTIIAIRQNQYQIEKLEKITNDLKDMLKIIVEGIK